MTHSRRPLKSSLAARRLIRATLRRHKSQHKAARALQLPNQAQLARADARAKRAWGMVKEETAPAVDREPLLASVERLERELAVLKSLVRAVTNTEKAG